MSHHDQYRTSEGDKLPKSLLIPGLANARRSYALRGDDAEQVEQPLVQHEALQQSRLVTRSFRLAPTEILETHRRSASSHFHWRK